MASVLRWAWKGSLALLATALLLLGWAGVIEPNRLPLRFGAPPELVALTLESGGDEPTLTRTAR